MGELKRMLVEEDAQTTAEYALVILGAAAVGAALIAWAANGKAISGFFGKVFSKLTDSIK